MTRPSTTLNYYSLALGAAGLAVLGYALFQGSIPPMLLAHSLTLVLFITLLARFPWLLFSREFSLTPAAVLGAGALYGLPAAAVFTALGLIVDFIAGLLRHIRRGPVSASMMSSLQTTGAAYGTLMLPLAGAIALVRQGDLYAATPLTAADGLLAGLLYGVFHALLFFLGEGFRGSLADRVSPRLARTVGLMELLPLPYIFLAIVTFPVSELGALIALGGLPAISAVTLNGVGIARESLERRVQDLSTLTSISDTLRSTLIMDELLPVIERHVTGLLEIDNFYVALYEPQDRQIWYPLAVKGGQPQAWPPRELAERLTDRVILESRPILLAQDAPDLLERIGLPGGEDAPEAWLGVPLIAPERTLGCLAVFSTSPDATFTGADQRLLTILSGQVSVAIQNALLYEQSQRRAAQLDTLSRITSTISASLDPQQVLSQVCKSVTRVGGAQRSAVFLIDETAGALQLAHAHGLSMRFQRSARSIQEMDEVQARSLRTGRPSLRADLGTARLGDEYLAALQDENIQAAGEFPLITPEGPLGFLSVYFGQPHTFEPEQIELLQTFAAQAALAVANARRYASTDTALSRRAHQLAILESIGRELSAAVYSDRLFELILDHALDFTNAPWGSIGLFDSRQERIEFKATRGYIPDRPSIHIEDSLAKPALLDLAPLNLGNIPPDAPGQDLTGGAVQSHLSVPLIHEDRALGILTLESPHPGVFTPNDQEFISQLAVQGAIAVLNASLYAETRRRLQDQATLYEFSKRLVGDLRIESVIDRILSGVGEALRAEAAGMYLLEEGRPVYQLRGVHPGEDELEAGHLPGNIMDGSWQDARPMTVGTGMLYLPSRTARQTSLAGACQDCQVVALHLRVGAENPGLVVAHIPADAVFSEEDLQLARAITSQGAIAIQNARLFADVAQGKDRLEAVLNSVEEGVLMVNGQGRVILANAALETLTRVPLQALMHGSLLELPERTLQALGLSTEEAAKLIARLQEGSSLEVDKLTFHLRETDERVLVRFLAPVWGQGRGAIGWVLVLRDITEEHQLNQARELITETLVHDLRSPIGTLSSALMILDDALPSDKPGNLISQTLEIARRSTKRVLNLIDALLDVSRLESGAMPLEPSEFSLHELVTELQAEFVPQANEMGILLHNHVPEAARPVVADREKVVRVLANLIDNALKFTPSGGQVSIAIDEDEDATRVKISDTGPGIPEQYQESIFDRFTQVPGRRGSRRGSGIGLAFCRMAIEAHGGRIWVEAAPEGGSEFNFTLPRRLSPGKAVLAHEETDPR